MITLNGKNIVESVFPNGETNFNVNKQELVDMVNEAAHMAGEGVPYTLGDARGIITVELVYESDVDLFRLFMLAEILKDAGVIANTTLMMEFVPYSQMDREMPGHNFSLKYFANLVNACGFACVCIRDPHSYVTPALLNNCVEYNGVGAGLACEYDYVMYPDAGAMKKYGEIIRKDAECYVRPLTLPKELFGVKRRNLVTGEIVSYDVIAPPDEDLTGKSVLIIDDLVMGGRTFKEAAKALRKMGAAKVDLHVTHLMPQAKEFYYSKGDGLINDIMTWDTLHVIPELNTVEDLDAPEKPTIGNILVAKGDMMTLWNDENVARLGFSKPEEVAVVFADPVNLYGVAGGGLAYFFRLKFPELYRTYKQWCNVMKEEHRERNIATVQLVVDEPNKGLWLHDRYFPSRAAMLMNTMPYGELHIEDSESAIERALEDLGTVCSKTQMDEDLGYEKRVLVLPALGCGIGGVRWAWAQPKLKEYAKKYIDAGIFTKVVIMEPGYEKGKFDIVDNGITE